jgi:hypothetical protein
VSVEPRAVKGKWFLEITNPRKPINDLRKKMRRKIHRYFVFIRTINIKNIAISRELLLSDSPLKKALTTYMSS